MTAVVSYHRLTPEMPPNLPAQGKPFLAVVVVREDVSVQWRSDVSNWLVAEGCLFMCAWGLDCTLWDDSVDYANLEQFSYGEIPEDRFVMTTWHDDEPLEEAIWFAKHSARHDAAALDVVLIIDVSRVDHSDEMLALWSKSQ